MLRGFTESCQSVRNWNQNVAIPATAKAAAVLSRPMGWSDRPVDASSLSLGRAHTWPKYSCCDIDLKARVKASRLDGSPTKPGLNGGGGCCQKVRSVPG